MPIEVWCEIACGNCSLVEVGRMTTGSRVPRRELRAEARKNGWTFKGGAALCRRCAAKEKPDAGE